MLPFSFREFVEVYHTKNTDEAFDAYLKFGGMPFLAHLNYQDVPSRDYLVDLYSSLVIKKYILRAIQHLL